MCFQQGDRTWWRPLYGSDRQAAADPLALTSTAGFVIIAAQVILGTALASLRHTVLCIIALGTPSLRGSGFSVGIMKSRMAGQEVTVLRTSVLTALHNRGCGPHTRPNRLLHTEQRYGFSWVSVWTPSGQPVHRIGGPGNVRERTWRPRWSMRVKDCEQVPH